MNRDRQMSKTEAIAVFQTEKVQGEVLFIQQSMGTKVTAYFSKLPAGLHGFHIHRAGDLRGEGCQGACEHYHRGSPQSHGSTPDSRGPRHTGDLGNIRQGRHYEYFLPKTTVHDLFGRSVIVHADEDDLGKGDHPDSHTTGHSGARIGCAIIGRASMEHCKPTDKSKTRKIKRTHRPSL